MIPFPGFEPPDPTVLAQMQAQQLKVNTASAKTQLANYAAIRRFGAITCTCKMFAPTPEEYNQAMWGCPLHGTFIITTEDLLT